MDSSSTFLFVVFLQHFLNWSGKWDSNSRSPAPKAGALSQTKLHPEKFGATRRIRTSHPNVRSVVFYPNELWSPIEFVSSVTIVIDTIHLD